MSDDMFKRLAAHFPPDRVSWRVGSTTQDKSKGMALAYIDARDVMERFDDVCGPDGWERRHPHVTGTTTCEIALWVPSKERWVVKADGAGDTAVEAEKGSLSDSFKRAAVNWGVGRYLYDLPTPWVALDKFKKIEDSEHAKLRALLSKGANQNTQTKTQPTGNNPGVVTAMKAAIDMCDSEPALDAWKDDNKVSFDRLSEDDYREVVAYWREAVRKARAARQSAAA